MTSSDRTEPPHRILYVENGIGYGGAVVCLRRLIRGLDRERFSPILVTSRTGVEYQGIAGEADWHHIPDKLVDVTEWRRWVDSMESRRLSKYLKFVLRQVVARSDDLLNFLPFFLRLFWLGLSRRPAIIHANNEPLCNRAAILVGKLLRVTVICHVRGEVQDGKLIRWLSRYPDHFIPVSHWLAKDAERIGILPEKQTVIYDGIAFRDLDLDAEGSAFRRRHGIPDDAFAVGLVGLLIPWKGQEIFIEAAKELVSSIPGLKMVLVGGTPERCRDFEVRLKEKVKDEGLEETVIFTGHEENICEVYRGLDVVVSASISPEPLGMVVFEAMAMERPVVAPAHGGAAEICQDEKTALLFRPGDAEGLARAISTYQQNPELLEKIGLAGRQRVLETFDVDLHAERVQEIYGRFLSNKPKCVKPPNQKA